MFITASQTARALGYTDNQVYYLLVMGRIEAIKIRDAWRVYYKAVHRYAQSRSETGDGSPPRDYVSRGGSGISIDLSFDGLPDDIRRRTSRLQGRRRRVEHQSRRPHPRLQSKLKPLIQLELFDPEGLCRLR